MTQLAALGGPSDVHQVGADFVPLFITQFARDAGRAPGAS